MSIFVSIPSYRDTECQHTIRDMLEKAETPNNVSFGVCFQYDKEDDKECFKLWPKELRPNQIRVDHVDHRKATGPCWARYRAQKLYQGEEYYLSLDSHMRFVKHWDKKLIALLGKCPSEKPIISAYPIDYELPNKLSTEQRPTLTCAKEIGADGMLRLVGKLLNRPLASPIKQWFWVSGFSFSKATVLQEVPYDPHLPFLFFGEESSMTVRLWTHGWDFYAPGVNLVYHLWSRDHRPVFRENLDVNNLEDKSRARVKYLLGEVDLQSLAPESLVELDAYGLGKTRTLHDYETAVGVSFAKGTVEDRAKWGNVSKSEFVDGFLEQMLALTATTKASE